MFQTKGTACAESLWRPGNKQRPQGENMEVEGAQGVSQAGKAGSGGRCGVLQAKVSIWLQV